MKRKREEKKEEGSKGEGEMVERKLACPEIHKKKRVKLSAPTESMSAKAFTTSRYKKLLEELEKKFGQDLMSLYRKRISLEGIPKDVELSNPQTWKN